MLWKIGHQMSSGGSLGCPASCWSQLQKCSEYAQIVVRGRRKPCETSTVTTSTMMDATATTCTVSKTSLEWCDTEGTHKKGGQHGCEYNSIIVPERICSEQKQDWMDRIRSTCICQGKETYVRNKRAIWWLNLWEDREAFGKNVHAACTVHVQELMLITIRHVCKRRWAIIAGASSLHVHIHLDFHSGWGTLKRSRSTHNQWDMY